MLVLGDTLRDKGFEPIEASIKLEELPAIILEIEKEPKFSKLGCTKKKLKTKDKNRLCNKYPRGKKLVFKESLLSRRLNSCFFSKFKSLSVVRNHCLNLDSLLNIRYTILL